MIHLIKLTLIKMATMNEQHEQDTPFNFAMLYYMGLNKLEERKLEAKDIGVKAYYQALRDIFIKISFKLSKEEKQDVNDMFKNAKKTILTPTVRQTESMMRPHIDTSALEELEDIDFKLWELMDKYKMIFPRIEHKRGLDHLYKKYGMEKEKNGKTD